MTRSAGGLGALDIETDDNRLLTASHDYTLARLLSEGIDLLVRHIGRHVDEVSGAGFSAELKPIAPSHPRTAAHDVEHGFQFAVMMRACSGGRLNHHGPG